MKNFEIVEQQIYRFHVKALIFKISKGVLFLIGTFLCLLIISEAPETEPITLKWVFLTKGLPFVGVLALIVLGCMFSNIEKNYRNRASRILKKSFQ